MTRARRAWITTAGPMRPRRLAAVLGAAVVAVTAVPAAGAHAIVLPGASRPADFQQYTLTVPTERDVPTVGVDLKIPGGIGFLLVQHSDGWKVDVVRRNDRIDEIRWTGGSIAPDFFEHFRFLARNPVEEGEIEWKVVQRYADGEVVRWIGGPASQTPASRTTISEGATPVDVVDVVSGKQAALGASTAQSSSEGRDGLTLALAAIGAIAGLLALGAAVLGRRRGVTQ
jgi:uncharacterized protein YcnI